MIKEHIIINYFNFLMEDLIIMDMEQGIYYFINKNEVIMRYNLEINILYPYSFPLSLVCIFFSLHWFEGKKILDELCLNKINKFKSINDK